MFVSSFYSDDFKVEFMCVLLNLVRKSSKSLPSSNDLKCVFFFLFFLCFVSCCNSLFVILLCAFQIFVFATPDVHGTCSYRNYHNP